MNAHAAPLPRVETLMKVCVVGAGYVGSGWAA